MSSATPFDLNTLLPVLAVTATALVILVADWFVKSADARPHAALALAGLAVAGARVVLNMTLPAGPAFLLVPARAGTGGAAAAAGAAAPALGMLRHDAFGLFVSATLILVAFLTVLISVDYLASRGIARAEYYVLLLLATAAMMLLAIANDLILIFLALETFSIALYILAGYVRGSRLSQEAAMKYFVLGAFAAGCLLYGVALTYAATGSTNLDAIGTYLAMHVHGLPNLIYMGLALVLVGLGFKVAMVPFHQWTPDVYEGAPLPVTAFMTAATKAAAFAALMRVLWTAFPALSGVWLPLVGGLAVVTMLVGNLAALVQSDAKRMLAYSSIAHAGYLLAAVASAGPVAATAAAPGASGAGASAGSAGSGGAAAFSSGAAALLFYLLVYALMNLGAFAVLAAMTRRAEVDEEGREATGINELAGLAHRHAGLAAALALFLIGLTGLPPTAGFLGKWYIFQAAVGARLPWLAVAVVINSVISAFYYLRPVVLMYMAPPASDEPVEVSTPGAVAVAVTAVVVALAIVLAGPLVQGAQAAAKGFGVGAVEEGGRGEVEPDAREAGVGAIP